MVRPRGVVTPSRAAGVSRNATSSHLSGRGGCGVYNRALGLKAVAVVSWRLTNSPVTSAKLVAALLRRSELLFRIIFEARPNKSSTFLYCRKLCLSLCGLLIALYTSIGTADLALADGFPDDVTKKYAVSLGIHRYEAYRQIFNIDTIRAFCEVNQTVTALEQAKYNAIDAGADEEQITAITNIKQEDLLAAFSRKHGLIDFEYATLSVAGYWPTYCDAFKRGWGVFGVHSVARVDGSNSRDAERVIESIFVNELQNHSASAFFNPAGRSAVLCKRETVNEKWYVGCRLQSMTGLSDWRVYLIAKSSDGRLFFNPVNGPSISLMSKVWSSVPTFLRDQINIANYAGPRFSVNEVLAAFQ